MEQLLHWRKQDTHAEHWHWYDCTPLFASTHVRGRGAWIGHMVYGIAIFPYVEFRTHPSP